MVPVESRFLYSIRQQSSFTWRSMVCELIDNAFDANASSVSLSWPGGQVFEIADDGIGTDDLTRLFTLGRRRDHDSNDVGRYGVGCKQALLWLWGISEIRSESDALRSIVINWPEIAEDAIPYPTIADVVVSDPIGIRGTTIHCRSDRNYPRFDDICSAIANTYTPGLELGKTIVVRLPKENPRRLQPRAWPKIDQDTFIDDTIEAAGRSVRIRMGIIAEGHANPYQKGFSFERTYRVIKESTLGANGFSVNRIAARITLGPEWELSTNKDDFTDYQDELSEAIRDRCHDLMKAASEQAVSIEDDAFNRELAQIVSGTVSTRREKRNPRESEGSVQPKSTGRKRQTAEKTTDNDGSVIADDIGVSRRRSGFTVESYEADSLTFGYYDEDGNRVRINTANSWLGQKHKERNQDALIPVVYGILAEHAVRRQATKNPLFKAQIEGDFCESWGQAVESVASKVLI